MQQQISIKFNAATSKQTNSLILIQTTNAYRHPFSDECQELLVLHAQQCADQEVASSMKSLAALGNSQYNELSGCLQR